MKDDVFIYYLNHTVANPECICNTFKQFYLSNFANNICRH